MAVQIMPKYLTLTCASCTHLGIAIATNTTCERAQRIDGCTDHAKILDLDVCTHLGIAIATDTTCERAQVDSIIAKATHHNRVLWLGDPASDEFECLFLDHSHGGNQRLPRRQLTCGMWVWWYETMHRHIMIQCMYIIIHNNRIKSCLSRLHKCHAYIHVHVHVLRLKSLIEMDLMLPYCTP